jgi:undecaprenyl-diphosphooligosaccharide---protein glycotransferase
MATHDAYAWMAGAKETGIWTGAPMSEFLQFSTRLSPGFTLDTINFWLPVFAAPLGRIPYGPTLRLVGDQRRESLAGIIGASAFGFFFRTRLGYGDTDILTLFLFPFCIWSRIDVFLLQE